MSEAAPLELSVGSGLVLAGVEWTVAALLAHTGRVVLRGGDGASAARVR
jgi:hypothetical protein